MIAQKKQKKSKQMKGVLTHQFIDQILVATLINKQFIKESLQKEYQAKLDQKVSSLNNVSMNDWLRNVNKSIIISNL